MFIYNSFGLIRLHVEFTQCTIAVLINLEMTCSGFRPPVINRDQDSLVAYSLCYLVRFRSAGR